MQVTGKIKKINPTQSFGENGFKKRELVVTTYEQYPQMILIEFVQDKCDLLNNFSMGQDVTVSINIRGREWTNPQGESKYFNTIQGWRIESAQNEPTQTPPPQPPAQNEDDLPF